MEHVHAAHAHGGDMASLMRHDHGTAAEGECVFYHALTFHIGVCQEILFPGWVTTSGLEIFGSAVALFVAGFLYEGLKYYRETLHKKYSTTTKDSQVNIAKTECAASGGCQPATVKYSMFSMGHAIQTVLHIFQTTCSYILMLVFMTYQIWLCMGLVLGMGLGYFVFGWRKATVVDSNEHCG